MPEETIEKKTEVRKVEVECIDYPWFHGNDPEPVPVGEKRMVRPDQKERLVKKGLVK